MSSTLRPRLLAGFGVLLALMAALSVLGLSLMRDLSDRAVSLSESNVPELVNTTHAEADLESMRQLQFRHLLESRNSEKDRIEAEIADLRAEVTEHLRERLRITPVAEADEIGEARAATAEWSRYVRLTTPSVIQSRSGQEARALETLSGPAQESFDALRGALGEMHDEEVAEAAAVGGAARASFAEARRNFLASVSAVISGAALLGLWFLVVRPLRRASSSESFRRRFQEALEMADTEDEALEITGRALASSARNVPVELLLADSSQAHLYRAVVAGPDPAGPGCTVDAPRACAAVRRGQATTFSSSEALGACPRLRDRPSGPCSAVCTPVAILGRTIGVLHATGPDGHPPTAEQQDLLETTGAQVGSRLGVIRAMSQSQLQASTDPLTGLLNRRSLEDRVRDLRRSRTPFVVAMADLDHFKVLNDSFGHETGDRALRVFSRVLAETVRAEDVVARHGGEEFVIVFPRCSVREAAEVLERVRERLRAALAAADGPEFTCSAGVAEAGPDESFHDVLRAADEALLAAKRSGRDRILIASSIRG
jgi:diguanylate cyclase (GGDEF)-like protein